MLRSKRARDDPAGDPARLARIAASVPGEHLLQSSPPVIVTPSPAGGVGELYDREAALALLRHPTPLPDTSYACARLLDALRHLPAAQRLASAADARWGRVASAFSIDPGLTHAVGRISFFSDIADVRDPLASLLSKVLNSRCQSRKYGTVADKALFAGAAATDARAGARRAILRHALLAALLGNLPTASSFVQGTEARSALYDLLEGPLADSFLQSVLHGCPAAAVWAVRELLVHLLVDQPALLDIVSSAIHFERFRELTAAAMAVVRRYLSVHLTRAWSALGQAARLTEPVHCTCLCSRRNRQVAPAQRCLHTSPARAGGWLLELAQQLQPFHEPMLNIAYRKPDTSALTFLTGVDVRERAPLVPIPGPPEAPSGAATEPEPADEEEEIDALMASMSVQVDARALLQSCAEARARREAAARAEQADGAVLANAERYLSRAHLDCVSALAAEAPSLEELLASYRFHAGELGMSVQVIEDMLALLAHHRNGTQTKQQRVRACVALQRLHPHAYNVLQLSVEFMREHRRRDPRVVGVLPREAMARQVAELERRWGTPGAVEATAACLHACQVCGKVHSNVRDPRSSYQRYYRHGLRDALKDYETGLVYCRRGKVSFRGACRDVPLAAIPLIGLRVALGDRCYQLCVRCACIMVPDREACDADPEAGGALLCCACTADARKQAVQEAPEERLARELDRSCAFCGRTASHPYLYPHGVVLCGRHHTPRVAREVEEAAPADAAASRHAVESAARRLDDARRARAQPQADRQRAAQRRRDRERRG